MTEALAPDWYLQDWVRHFEKKQADLVNDLGWHKNTAHRLWHSNQPYRRDEINAVAAWLKIEPFELLLPPAEALKIRRVRELLAQESRIGAGEMPPAPSMPGRTGTAA